MGSVPCKSSISCAAEQMTSRFQKHYIYGMSPTDQYIPGTCNIGKEEIRMRRNYSLVMISITIGLAVLLWFLNVDRLWRLTLFLPATAAAIGVVQWRSKFCVYFGLKGIFNFDQLGENMPVEAVEMINADKAKARRLILTAVLIGIIVATAFYFMPVN